MSSDGKSFILADKKTYFRCSFCKKGFRDSYDLNRHVQSRHFESISDTKSFMQFDHDIEENMNLEESKKDRFKCDSCNSSFSTREGLFKHIDFCHNVNMIKNHLNKHNR